VGERVAEEYDRRFGELTSQSIAPLLDAAGAAAGVQLLDVACGPGYVAAAASRRAVNSNVLGIDFSSAMVSRHPICIPILNFGSETRKNLIFSLPPLTPSS
jgi:ubiquinone/menaquinone biosynthesis C-methylase UbiE